jgi:ABC-type bacteriocin/lantibiotic exporter with double-glycine peptidase domain
MFQAFDSMFSWFGVLFAVVAVFVIFSIILTFWRSIKWGKVLDQTSSEAQPAVAQREIIREVVKIRCSYCGNLYDESMDKCPYCGAKR